MSGDLFSSVQTKTIEPVRVFILDESCALCVAATGEYNWGNLCCRARFITGQPGIDWRRGWMARWKLREIPEFYAEIERAVMARWETTKAGAVNG